MSNKKQWEKDAEQLKKDLDNRPKNIIRNEVDITLPEPPKPPPPIKPKGKASPSDRPAKKDHQARDILGI